MRYSNPGSFRAQASFLRRQFLQGSDLPFANVLTDEVIAQALTSDETTGSGGRALSSDSQRSVVGRLPRIGLVANERRQHRNDGLGPHSKAASPE